MPYKEKIELSDIEPYLLEGLRDFIKKVLNLTEIYSNEVKMPAAIPPKKYTEMTNRLMVGGITSSVFTHIAKGIENDPVKGIYQDEALLQESAEIRLGKITNLKKLGVITNVSINDLPLEQREVSFYVREAEMKKLLQDIEELILKKELAKEQEKEAKKRENEIYYNENNDTLNLGQISFQVSGWEDATCKAFFNNPNENKEVDLTEIIFEMTGEEYQKSQNAQHMESVRQAVYRLNKKIDKNFGKKDYFDFSVKTRKLTKTQTDT